MKRKRRAVITVETHRLTVVRKKRAAFRYRCERCATEVQMCTPDEVASFLGISVREIYRRVETGTLHFVETTTGRLFICSQSVSGMSDQFKSALSRRRIGDV